MSKIRRISMAALACAVAVWAREPVRSKKAMVVAQEPHAAEVGLEVLRNGGNAIDAAVAVGFALAVTLPSAGNLGGGGFLLVRFADGRTNFIDFRERAPIAAKRDMYLDASGNLTKDSTVGWRAAGIPGTVRGLELAHSKYGSKPWAELVEPSVKLAREGITVSYALSRSIRGSASLMGQFAESKRIFLNGGKHLEMDDRLVQSELASTLARIAKGGAKEFYEGETARILAEEMKKHGGLITRRDLKDYRAIERTPITGRYKGHEIITAPPPSSGGLGLLQMCGVLEGSGYEKAGAGSAAAIHFLAEAMRRYYADRSEHLADPGFFKVPVRGLLDPRYVSGVRQSIDPDRATPSSEIKAGKPGDYESADTTHFSIVDAQGNAVALTYTINGGYGNGVTVPRLGFLLNNEMDDFAAKPGFPNMFGLVQGEGNAIAPRKTPLSSMTPTIVTKDGKLYMVIGAPGGSRIITGVTQVLLNVIDHGMNMQDAIDAPRFHHQWQPDKLSLERGFSPDTVALLEKRGHQIDSIRAVAVVESILIDGGWLQGATDGRGAGKAAGY
ncbi:MAG: gamma-glutamyltransferase [Acidobacteria bacterium]|nr:gamma-glutamyltransferase [Acidobacteriota bacterium]